MAEQTPEAAVAPEAKTEAPATNTNPEPAQAPEQKPESPDMHGFTSDQLKEMKAFYDANGGFEKVKSRISNPEPKPVTPAQTAPEAPQTTEQPQTTQGPASPQQAPQTPSGAVTQSEMMDQYYFEQLSKQEKYAPIAKEISNGSLLKEMASLGIDIHNPDGSYNDARINAYLGIKAQTVPAKQTQTEPEASTAPTVDYVAVGEKITSKEEAYAVLVQEGHPRMDDAVAFLKKEFNPEAGQKQTN